MLFHFIIVLMNVTLFHNDIVIYKTCVLFKAIQFIYVNDD